MEFKCETTRLLQALGLANVFNNEKELGSHSGYFYFRLDEGNLEIQSRTLNGSIKLHIPVVGVKDGEATCHSASMLRLLKKSTAEEISFKSEKSHAFFIHERSKHKIMAIPPANFPKLIWDKNLKYNELSSYNVETSFPLLNEIPTDTPKFQVNGVLLEVNKETTRAIATDLNRIGILELDNKDYSGEPFSVFFPKIFSHDLPKLAAMTEKIGISQNENTIFIKSENFTVFVPKLEGRFPDYKPVITISPEVSIAVDRKEMLLAVERSFVTADTESLIIDLEFENNELMMHTQTSRDSYGKEILDIDYTDAPFKIKINGGFLKYFLTKSPSDSVYLEVTADKSRVGLRDSVFNYKHVFGTMRQV